MGDTARRMIAELNVALPDYLNIVSPGATWKVRWRVAFVKIGCW